MEKAKVSIILPVYNQERYIEQCLESVCNQTLKDIEIIVINDGSTDGSLAIIKKIAETDCRIKIIDKKNAGYGSAMNAGLAAATGEYIGIVETDDFIAENMYEKLYQLSNKGTIDIIKCNFYNCRELPNGALQYSIDNERYNIKQDLKSNILDNPEILIGHPSIWSAIYRHDFLKINNIKFKEIPGAGWVDNPFFFETFLKSRTYIYTNNPYYYYRKFNPDSSSNKLTNPVLPLERMIDNLEVLEHSRYADNLTFLKLLYARAFSYYGCSYYTGDYEKNFELIDTYAHKLMTKLDLDIVSNYFSWQDQYNYITNNSAVIKLKYMGPKVLIYNWAPFDNKNGVGGGVTIYCRNLIETILKESPLTQIYFLSSGWAYDLSKDHPFIRQIKNVFGSRVHQFEIVNSPIPADQWLIRKNPVVALKNEKLKSIFKEFLVTFGKFDAIHFNNIEGLSLDIFDLKDEFKDTKFIYSLHNYAPICPTVMYFQKFNHHTCNPNHTAADCVNCVFQPDSSKTTSIIYNRAVPISSTSNADLWFKNIGIDKFDLSCTPQEVLEFSKQVIKILNKNCDKILAVSKRVYDIAADNGFDENKLVVSYIGTKVAKYQHRKSNSSHSNGLHLLFLGSNTNNEEKGYPFLINTLSQIDQKYASKIDLTLTMTNADNSVNDKLSNFRSVKIINGYKHSDLENICNGCDLSIIPVIWEDNLPQVAIESVAYGVPVLSSSAGGASELCTNELFKFEAGNSKALLDKIIHFLEYPKLIDLYWKSHTGLVTLPEHWHELSTKYYQLKEVDNVTLSKEDIYSIILEHNFLTDYFKANDKIK